MGLWTLEWNVMNMLAGTILLLAVLLFFAKSWSKGIVLIIQVLTFLSLAYLLLIDTPYSPLESPFYLVFVLLILGFLGYLIYRNIRDYYKTRGTSEV